MCWSVLSSVDAPWIKMDKNTPRGFPWIQEGINWGGTINRVWISILILTSCDISKPRSSRATWGKSKSSAPCWPAACMSQSQLFPTWGRIYRRQKPKSWFHHLLFGNSEVNQEQIISRVPEASVRWLLTWTVQRQPAPTLVLTWLT